MCVLFWANLPGIFDQPAKPYRTHQAICMNLPRLARVLVDQPTDSTGYHLYMNVAEGHTEDYAG
jgi:hypothetical protein